MKNIIFDLNKNIKLEMIFVKGGQFLMGDDTKAEGNIEPENKSVEDFYISKYPITELQYSAIMKTSNSDENNVPAIFIGLKETSEFINKLSELIGYNFSLPDEVEWEYAARGGINNKGYIYSGSDNINDVAWYGSLRTGPVEVGLKRPNELNIYDMSGNVIEITNTTGQYKNENGELTDIIITRGGSWISDKTWCQNNVRGTIKLNDNSNNNFTGFRVVIRNINILNKSN